MSVFYANRNTREVEVRDEPSPRLDHLSNWSRHESRADAEASFAPAANLVVNDGILSRPGMSAAPTIAPRKVTGEQAPPSTAPAVAAAKAPARDRAGKVKGGDHPADPANLPSTALGDGRGGDGPDVAVADDSVTPDKGSAVKRTAR